MAEDVVTAEEARKFQKYPRRSNFDIINELSKRAMTNPEFKEFMGTKGGAPGNRLRRLYRAGMIDKVTNPDTGRVMYVASKNAWDIFEKEFPIEYERHEDKIPLLR